MDEHKENSVSSEFPKIIIARVILVIFFSVGIAGIIIPQSRDLFTLLTPLALLLSFVVLVAFHRPVSLRKELLVFSTIFIISFVIEAVGVNTGKIFGSYSYGQGLGIKLFNTPLLIGLNWVMLVYCTAVLADRIRIPVLLKISAAALLMVLYDIIMEQLAPEIKMWSFSGNSVPVINYVSWFMISFLFHTFLRLADINPENRMAGFIFYVQLLFFIVLALFFKLLQ